jgi:Uracil DNA glycosylase superfamily
VGTSFCPGYVGEPFATLVTDYPGEDVYPPARFRTEWGPIFHRGRLDGSARVLVLGQDPAAHETITRRILVGEAGQRVQGLLRRVGILSGYTLVNTFLYSVYGQGGGNAHAGDPLVAGYRNRWLDALLVGTGVTAVVTLGTLADAAYRAWAATQPAAAAVLHHARLRHPTYPESAAGHGGTTLEQATAALHADWSAHLADLAAHVQPEGAVDLTPYAGHWLPGDLAPIPAQDLPPGSPRWWGDLQAWADRVGDDATAKRATIRVTVPVGSRTWLP